MINVTIDGKMLQVDENQTILDACKQNASIFLHCAI